MIIKANNLGEFILLAAASQDKVNTLDEESAIKIRNNLSAGIEARIAETRKANRPPCDTAEIIVD